MPQLSYKVFIETEWGFFKHNSNQLFVMEYIRIHKNSKEYINKTYERGDWKTYKAQAYAPTF